MRQKILVGLWSLLPLLRNAQFMPGSYSLLADSQKVYVGDIEYRHSNLLVKEANGKKTKYLSDEVYCARTATQRYVSASGFMLPGGFKAKGNTLVELVDSGRFCLLKYDYSTASGGYGSPGGVMGVSAESIYLVQQAGTTGAVALPPYAWTNKGKKLSEALAPYPYAANRPDLQELLSHQQIDADNLVAFFRALNANQPMAATELKATKTSKSKERPIEDPFGGD